MTIHVTAEDIENGIPQDACHCPVALAVKRATGSDDVDINDDICIGFPGQDVRDVFEAPDEVCDFVAAFDNYEGVEPFSFDLDYEPAP